MHNRSSLPTACVLLLLMAGGARAEKPSIKCYTNEDGVRECGNVVPPEHAQQAIDLKGKTGLTLQRQERAKTPEELAAEAAAREEREKAEREAKAKAAADQILLQTYGSEEDILMARDGQVASLASQVKLSEGRIEKLNKQLDEMIAEAAQAQKSGKPVSENLSAGIDAMRRELTGHRTLIDARTVEIKAIQEKAEADLARFRSLKKPN